MDEIVAQLRRDLIAAEFGERRSFERRLADARAKIGHARRSMARALQIGRTPRVPSPDSRCGAGMTILTQDQIATVIRRSDPRNLFANEAECWQLAIDSTLIWHMGGDYGVKAVALIERGVLTLARRSYCRAPKAT